MDESLQELEKELVALRPRAASRELIERIGRDLPPAAAGGRSAFATATSLTSWKWAGWRLAAAAAVVALVGFGVSRMVLPRATAPAEVAPAPLAEARPAALPVAPAPGIDADVYRPVKASTVLYDLQDEGPAVGADRQPGRQARFRYVDTVTWTNPRSRASLRMSVPRDEVRVLPAKFN